MTKIARVFQSGNSQAIRLPKEFRVEVESLEITREGDALILRPATAGQKPWASLNAAVARGLSSDFDASSSEMDDQLRPDLDALFE